MRLHNALCVTSTLLLLAACHADQQSLKDLEVVEQTRDPRVVVQTEVSCTEISDACGRLFEERGAACLQLTESGDAATRARMRSCAVNDFRQALAHLPPASDRLRATRGLAEAVRISRDNAAGPAARAADKAELARLASQLDVMPGGAPYGAYYAANGALNAVLTGDVPAGSACPTLKGARAGLPTGAVPGDLAPRLDRLRTELTQAAANRSCT